MARFLFALIGLAGALLPMAAGAAGALAVAIEADKSESVGWATGSTLAEVRNNALEECRLASREDGYPGTRCKIVTTFENQCAAYAWTDEIGGFGWAVAPSRAKAGSAAVARCKASTRNGATCAVVESFCD